MGADGFVVTGSNDRADLPPLEKVSFLLIALTAASVLSGFLFGYDTGIVSGAMVIIRAQMDLNDLWQELVVSVTLGAAAISAFIGGILNSKFGRKMVIIGCSILFIAGALILAFSPSKEVLLVGRIVLGLAIGASSSTIPAYIAECSPAHVRGRLLAMFQMSMTAGFFLAAIVAASLTYIQDTNLSWRLMLGLGGVPALIQLIAISFMPESPRWLALNRKEQQAYQVMLRIYGDGETARKHAEFELLAIKESNEQSDREKEEMGASNQSTLLAMLRIPHLRKALVIGCSLQMFQQLSGVNTVNYYGATIIIMSGIQSHTVAIWLTAVTSGVKFFSTFIAVYLVEKIGRRLLLLCSTLCVFLMLVLLGISFTVIALLSPDSSGIENGTDLHNGVMCQHLGCDACSYKAKCGFCYESGTADKTGACVSIGDKSQWALYGRCSQNINATGDSDRFIDSDAVWNYGYCPTTFSWLPILGLVLYLCSFASGYAPMPWTINAEIFPNWARSTGNAMSTTINYAFNLLISLTFLTLARAITRQGAFFLYAGLTLIALIWFYLVVPETKNKEMEEIQDLLKGPWFSRGRPPIGSLNANDSIKHSSRKNSAKIKPA